VQSLFVSMHDYSQGPLCFRLSGRAWEVGLADWPKGVLHVRPAERGRVPSWMGQPSTLSGQLCQAMRDVLAREGREGEWLTRSAALELKNLRESYAELLDQGTAPLEDQPDGAAWHTFAGGAVNRLLGAGLEEKSGKRWIAGNLSLRCKDLPVTAATYYLAVIPAAVLMVACGGGSTPEPATPTAAATEEKAPEASAPAPEAKSEAPAPGAEKPAEAAPAAEKK
jgi:hypothetical protein